MEAKKHPALLVVIIALALACVAGVVLAGLEIAKFSSNENKLNAKDGELRRLLTAEKVALTPENVELAKSNLASYTAAEADLRTSLAGAAGSRFDVEFKGDPGDLGSEIKEFVERWHGRMKTENVRILAGKPEEFAFGFSRYYQTGVNPQKSLPAVYRQTKIVDFLLKTLLDAKIKEDLRLVSVSRQPVELIGVNTGNYNKDETPAVHDGALNRDTLLRSETFRIRFIARTGVVRRFVNAVTDAHRPLCVRGVDILPATPEQLQEPKPAGAPALPAGFFGEPAPAPAAPGAKPESAGPVVVVPETVVDATPSDITVTLAFVDVQKPEAPVLPAGNP